MNEFAASALTGLFFAAVAGVGWLCVHIPIVGWIAKLAVVAAIGLALPACVVFVVLVVDLPKHEYAAAAAAVVVGGILAIPVLLVCGQECFRLLKPPPSRWPWQA